jgi:phage terminase small subunit
MAKKKLTDKQRLFVKHYILTRNATQSAIKAGYSERTARSIGQRLLTNVDIKKAIEKRFEKVEQPLDTSIDNLVKQLGKQAYADMRDFVEITERPYYKVDMEGNLILDADNKAIIDGYESFIKMKPLEEIDGTLITEIKQTKDGIQFKRTDPQKAIEMLGKYRKMFTEKVEHSGEGAPINVVFRANRPPKKE